MYKNILIATDGSELADKAVLHGLALAKALNAKVTLLTVSEPMWSRGGRRSEDRMRKRPAGPGGSAEPSQPRRFFRIPKGLVVGTQLLRVI